MPYLIKNADGLIVGRCTNRPGPGNILPDGSPEIIEYVEEDTPESVEFMNRPININQPSIADLVLTIEDLKMQLNKENIAVNGGIVKA
jgi:hypothetical protein